MWISKKRLEEIEHRIKRLEEIEHRIKRLEDRDTMPRMVVPRDSMSLIYWPYSGPDTVPVVDVVQRIVDHLDLTITRTVEKPSTVELKKKAEPWTEYIKSPTKTTTTKPQKKRK